MISVEGRHVWKDRRGNADAVSDRCGQAREQFLVHGHASPVASGEGSHGAARMSRRACARASTGRGRSRYRLSSELERRGRRLHIALVPDLPGCSAFGATPRRPCPRSRRTPLPPGSMPVRQPVGQGRRQAGPQEKSERRPRPKGRRRTRSRRGGLRLAHAVRGRDARPGLAEPLHVERALRHAARHESTRDVLRPLFRQALIVRPRCPERSACPARSRAAWSGEEHQIDAALGGERALDLGDRGLEPLLAAQIGIGAPHRLLEPAVERDLRIGGRPWRPVAPALVKSGEQPGAPRSAPRRDRRPASGTRRYRAGPAHPLAESTALN